MIANAGAPPVEADVDEQEGKGAKATDLTASNMKAQAGGGNATGRGKPAAEGAVEDAPESHLGGKGMDPSEYSSSPEGQKRRAAAENSEPAGGKGTTPNLTHSLDVDEDVSARESEATVAAAANPGTEAPKSYGALAQAGNPEDEGPPAAQAAATAAVAETSKTTEATHVITKASAVETRGGGAQAKAPGAVANVPAKRVETAGAEGRTNAAAAVQLPEPGAVKNVLIRGGIGSTSKQTSKHEQLRKKLMEAISEIFVQKQGDLLHSDDGVQGNWAPAWVTDQLERVLGDVTRDMMHLASPGNAAKWIAMRALQKQGFPSSMDQLKRSESDRKKRINWGNRQSVSRMRLGD